MRLLIILLFFSTSFVTAQDKIEMWQEPSHQLVYQDDDIRILDVRIVPGVISEFHFHHKATFYVTIQDANLKVQNLGEKWSRPANVPYRKPGTIMEMSSAYIENNIFHRVHNIDDVTFHLVAVVNLTDNPGYKSEKGGYMDELVNNPWFNEHRVNLKSGESSDVLSYENDVVMVMYKDGKSHVLENGTAHSYKSKGSAFSVHRAGTEFRLVNNGGTSNEFILMELIRK